MDELETSGEGVQTQVDPTALGLERNALLEDQVRALRQMVEDQVRALRQMSEDHEKALRDNETELLQRDESLAAMAAEIASIRLSRTWKASRFMARSAGPLLPAARSGRRQLRRLKTAGDHGMEPNLRGHVKADVSRVIGEATLPGRPWHFGSSSPSDVNRERRVDEAVLAETEIVNSGLADALEEALLDRRELSIPQLAEGLEIVRMRPEGGAIPTLDWQDIVEAESALEILGSQPRTARRVRGTTNAKVLVDARSLQDQEFADREVAQHGRSVTEQLRQQLGGCSFIALVDEGLPALSAQLRSMFESTIATPDIRRLVDLDLFVELSPATHSVGCLVPILKNDEIYKMVLFYDLIPLEYPWHYLKTESDRIRYFSRLATLGSYDLVLADSKSTAEGVTNRFGVDRERILISGVSIEVAAQPVHSLDETVFRPPYVLVPSGSDTRKNLLSAIGAVAIARQGAHRSLRVVVVGSLLAPLIEAAEDVAGALGIPPADMSFVADVSHDVLQAAFSRATAVIVPSYAEGFSMPVGEALACGTPVVASDIPVHRELLGNGWWLRSPDDVEGMAEALRRVLRNPSSVVASQTRNCGDVTSTHHLESVVRSALSGWTDAIGLADDSVPPVAERVNSIAGSTKVGRTRPSIAVVTPWPPQQSGVADYSAATLRELARLARVTVFTNCTTPEPASSVDIRQMSINAYTDRAFDVTISVVGNSHFHLPELSYLRDFGGACISHGDRMLELYRWWKGPEYAAWLVSSAEIAIDAKQIDQHLDLEALPRSGFDEVVRFSDPLIVHSHSLAARIGAETGKSPSVVPFVPCNLPSADIIDTAMVKAARSELGFDPNSFHLICTGSVYPRTKAEDVVLGAVGWLRSWGISAHIHLVGTCQEPDRSMLLDLAGDLGVPDSLTFYGRQSRDIVNQFLLAGDVAVQLRLASMLSLSASAADAAAFGLPVVTLPEIITEMALPGYAVGVPEEPRPLLLAEVLARLHLFRQNHAKQIEDQRQKYLEARSLPSYAQALLATLGFEGT